MTWRQWQREAILRMVCETVLENGIYTFRVITGTDFMAFNRHLYATAMTNRLCITTCLVAIFVLHVSTVGASFVNLHLDVVYDSGNSSNGGTWSLAAQSGGEGVFALGVTLTGIDNSVNFHVPSGTVNGSDGAGFSTLINNAALGGRQIFAAQQALPTSASEQGIFYGVGTQNNAAPSSLLTYPPGTNTTGPTITSLDAPQNLPWASGHLSTAFEVASGTFSAGSVPAIDLNSPLNQALTLISTPFSSSDVGDIAEATISLAAFTTNLGITIQQGDFNGDDIVDAADYTAWRDTLGLAVFPGTNADASGNGLIDQADYDIWAANYGASSPSSSLANASAVPEPGGSILLLIGSLIASAKRCARAA